MLFQRRVLERWRSAHAERLDSWRALHRRGRLARYLVARMLAAAGLSRWLVIRRRDFVLRFYPSSISIALWLEPDSRGTDEEFFQRYLRPGDVVIDVGANIGHLSLQAARSVGATGRVVAIEPHPRTFRYLVGNLALNRARNVQPINVAVGERDGTVRFSSRSQDDQNAVVTDGADLTVPVRPLDAVAPRDAPIALLKIDVEGYERFVLAGAPETLGRTDCVYFEAYDRAFARFGYTTSDLLALLTAAGFSPLRLDQSGQPVPVSLAYRADRCENLLAARDLDVLRARLVGR